MGSGLGKRHHGHWDHSLSWPSLGDFISTIEGKGSVKMPARDYFIDKPVTGKRLDTLKGLPFGDYDQWSRVQGSQCHRGKGQQLEAGRKRQPGRGYSSQKRNRLPEQSLFSTIVIAVILISSVMVLYASIFDHITLSAHESHILTIIIGMGMGYLLRGK